MAIQRIIVNPDFEEMIKRPELVIINDITFDDLRVAISASKKVILGILSPLGMAADLDNVLVNVQFQMNQRVSVATIRTDSGRMATLTRQHLQSYVDQVARNETKDWLKFIKPDQNKRFDDFEATLDIVSDPLEILTNEYKSQAILSELQEILGDRDYELFYLYHLEDVTYKQLSAVYKLTIRQVKKIVDKGLWIAQVVLNSKLEAVPGEPSLKLARHVVTKTFPAHWIAEIVSGQLSVLEVSQIQEVSIHIAKGRVNFANRLIQISYETLLGAVDE